MWLGKLLSRLNPDNKKLSQSITRITGKPPRNIEVYRLALRHSSSAGDSGKQPGKNHNERLEYLGDAILGAVVAEFLFKKYPFKDEGFLTDIRSRLVNRERLTGLALKIGINNLIEFNTRQKNGMQSRSMYGDAMEAVIGAVYLDRGFKFCRHFILEKLIGNHFDLEEIISTDANYKSRVIEWSQRGNYEVRFDISAMGKDHLRQFVAGISVNGLRVATGKGVNKKKAEQAAAEALMNLIKEDTLPTLPPRPERRREEQHEAVSNTETVEETMLHAASNQAGDFEESTTANDTTDENDEEQ